MQLRAFLLWSLEADSHPVLCTISFPVWDPWVCFIPDSCLIPVSQCSHWGAAPVPLTSALVPSLRPLSHPALALPLSTGFPISFNSKNIQLHFIFPCSFLHACWYFPFQTFPPLAELVGNFTQGTSFSSKKQPKESPLPEPCSFHYYPARALVLLGRKLKQKLKLTKKKLCLTFFFSCGVLHSVLSETAVVHHRSMW